MSKTKWITVAVITLLVFLVLMFGTMMLGMGSYQNVGPVWMRDFMPFGGMMMMPMMMFMCLIRAYRLGSMGRILAATGQGH